LRTDPKACSTPETPSDSSCIAAFATMPAPDALRRATTGASVAGQKSASDVVPLVLGIPATWMLSFTTMGTPPRAPVRGPVASELTASSAP
jgi:hypothetical protein